MGDQYKELYKEKGIITTALMVDASIYSFNLINPPIWSKLIKEMEEINKEVEEFNKICWPDILRAHTQEKVYTNFRAIYGDIKILSLSIMGRILNTISIDEKKMVTILGSDSPDAGQRCGLQGIRAAKEEAVKLIQYIIKNWDIKKFKVYKNSNLVLSD